MTHPPWLRRAEPRQRLQLWRIQERLDTRLQEASAQELPSADCLDRQLTEAVSATAETPVTLCTAMARFPSRQPLESVDCGFQSSVDRQKLQELATGRFIAHGDHGVFLGPPGTGKTPLAMALGLKAGPQGQRTLFPSAMSLVAARTKAYAENRRAERLKPYRLPKLLIIDEIGAMPIDQQGAHLFFQLISRRYERGSIVLTSKQSCGPWGEGFGNAIIATAVRDRLLHHSVVMNITGASYRLRGKQQAGLLKNPESSLASSPRGGDFSSIDSDPFSIIVDN